MDLGSLVTGCCITANLAAGAAGILNREGRAGWAGISAIAVLGMSNWFRFSGEYINRFAPAAPDWVDRGMVWIAIPALAMGIPVLLYEGGKQLARARR